MPVHARRGESPLTLDPPFVTSAANGVGLVPARHVEMHGDLPDLHPQARAWSRRTA